MISYQKSLNKIPLKSIPILTSIKIVELDSSNNIISSGSGFFYFIGDEKEHIFTIITNKHVISSSDTIGVEVPIIKNGIRGAQRFILKLSSIIMNHPNPNVDLVVICINNIIDEIEKNEMIPDFIFYSKDDFPNIELNFIEDIFMIGYPNGIEDNFNHYPIIRKGITATHPLKNFNGNNEFLADISIFPGSSGSPVIIYKNGLDISQNKNNTYFNIGNEAIYLVGIAYAGYQREDFNPVYIPTTLSGLVVENKTLLNLGKIISYKELEFLEKYIIEQIKKKESIKKFLK